MLAKCIIRHGTIEAINAYPNKVREKGGDATVTEEFIALYEIRKCDNANEMIRNAFEKAVLALMGTLDKADKEIKELRSLVENQTAQRRRRIPVIPNLKYILLWCGVIGIATWMDSKNFSATLASTIVIAGTGFLCYLAFLSKGAAGDISDQRNSNGGAVPNA